MLVGCYSLDLYCDAEIHKEGKVRRMPQTFKGQERSQCLRQAKIAGWKIGTLRQICPECAKQGAK